MSSWAKPGVKCVCMPQRPAGEAPAQRQPGANYPETNGIYTIRGIVFDSSDGEMLFLLREVVNTPARGLEPGFGARHFRPLAYKPQSLEHDVAKFRDVPAHAPVLDSEDA